MNNLIDTIARGDNSTFLRLEIVQQADGVHVLELHIDGLIFPISEIDPFSGAPILEGLIAGFQCLTLDQLETLRTMGYTDLV